MSGTLSSSPSIAGGAILGPRGAEHIGRIPDIDP
jgi:hypothetical protein